MTTFHNVSLASGASIHYASAGADDAPVVLLLHGFPSSSNQFRNLIPLLSDKYRVLAPDLPSYGHTTVPEGFEFTFANFATVVGEFLDALSVKKFAVYVFDYGAPTGLRLALKRPEAVAAIVSQNGNAYVEGLGPFWDPLRVWWATEASANATSGGKDDPATRAALDALSGDIGWTKGMYLDGVPPSIIDRVDPAAWTLDYLSTLSTPEKRKVQIDIFWDYRTNVAVYPKFQEYFRASQVPLLAVWGKGDTIFIAPGAQAFQRDLPNARVELLDTGHFALETHVNEIGKLIRDFLNDVKF